MSSSSCNAKNGLSKFLYSGAIFSTSTSKAFPIALHAKIFIEKRSSFFTFGCRIMRSISNILKSSSDSCLETFLMNLKSALSLKKTFEMTLEIVLSSSTGGRNFDKILFLNSGKNASSERILASVRERLKALPIKTVLM